MTEIQNPAALGARTGLENSSCVRADNSPIVQNSPQPQGISPGRLEGRDAHVAKADRYDAVVVIPVRLAVDIAAAAEHGKGGAP